MGSEANVVRLLGLPGICQGIAKIEPADDGLRVALEHIAVHHDGFASTAASAQGDAQAERGIKMIRLQPQRLSIGRDGVLRLLGGLVDAPQGVVKRRLVGLQGDGAQRAAQCLLELPNAAQHRGRQIEHARVIGSHRQRLLKLDQGVVHMPGGQQRLNGHAQPGD